MGNRDDRWHREDDSTRTVPPRWLRQIVPGIVAATWTSSHVSAVGNCDGGPSLGSPRALKTRFSIITAVFMRGGLVLLPGVATRTTFGGEGSRDRGTRNEYLWQNHGRYHTIGRQFTSAYVSATLSWLRSRDLSAGSRVGCPQWVLFVSFESPQVPIPWGRGILKSRRKDQFQVAY